jgi:hypothetical protein
MLKQKKDLAFSAVQNMGNISNYQNYFVFLRKNKRE